ncbi:MAG: hypothetical protein IAE91_06000 [Ignavibacteriaceae bacterium]|nr:hypothetical protein [Ignavibacteriaceae bacterium]
MPQIHPDEETKNRIKNLGIVGKALSEETNENQGATSVFLAKSSLKEFENGIKKLELDPESSAGMQYLINFLDKLIDKKMEQLSK